MKFIILFLFIFIVGCEQKICTEWKIEEQTTRPYIVFMMKNFPLAMTEVKSKVRVCKKWEKSDAVIYEQPNATAERPAQPALDQSRRLVPVRSSRWLGVLFLLPLFFFVLPDIPFSCVISYGESLPQNGHGVDGF